MSNKTIFTGRELRLRNTTSKLSETEITTNKETVKIKSASFSDNSNSLDKPLTITGDLTVNGNAIISGSVTSENPAIDIVRHLLPEVGVVADSSLLPVRKDGDTGWHVKNTAGPPQKANYYLYGDTNTENTYTLEDLKFMSLLVNIITGGNMFLFVYTKPQGAGDAGTWYRSRINYGFQTGSTTETGETLLYVGSDDLTENPEDIFTNVKRAKLTEEAFSSEGPKDPSEEILTIGIGTDSSAGVNSIDYVLKVFSYKMKHRINSFLFVLDIEYDETQTRVLIESYGYQSAGDVNTAITTALIPYETSVEIDGRNYLSQAQILAYNWQTEGQVDVLIDGRAYLTEPEIQALIDGSGDSKYFKAYLDNGGVSVNGQDNTWYLSTANNFIVREGGANFAVDKYTLPEDGNYKVDVNLVADTFTDEFKTVVEALDASDNVEEKYNLDWSSDAYGRHSSLVMPNRTAGKKIRVNIYNPSALGQTIAGKVEPVEVVATPPGAYPQFGGTYERVAVGLMRNTSPPRQFIADPSGTPGAIYRKDNGGTTYILYKLGNNYWYMSNHTTATLDANLSANSNNWQLIGDLLTAPNGYLGQNLNVSQTQSAGNVGGYHGPGAGAASWATGSFSDPTAGTPEYNTHFTIHKV